MPMTWIIVILIVAAAILGYLLWRSSTTPKVSISMRENSGILEPAPGVSYNTGQVPNNPAPPAPADVDATSFRKLSAMTGKLQHVPLVNNSYGKMASNLKPVNLSLKINSMVTSSLQHIPVLGTALAMPSKFAGRVGSTVSSAIGSIF